MAEKRHYWSPTKWHLPVASIICYCSAKDFAGGLDINPDRMVDMVHALDCRHRQSRISTLFYARYVQRRSTPGFDAAFEIFWNQLARYAAQRSGSSRATGFVVGNAGVASSSAEKRRVRFGRYCGKLPVIELNLSIVGASNWRPESLPP